VAEGSRERQEKVLGLGSCVLVGSFLLFFLFPSRVSKQSLDPVVLVKVLEEVFGHVMSR
jgi:hypothetical protein